MLTFEVILPLVFDREVPCLCTITSKHYVTILYHLDNELIWNQAKTN